MSDVISNQWAGQANRLAQLPSGHQMLINGRAPKQGEVMRLPTLAKTLRAIAEGGSPGLLHRQGGRKDGVFCPGTRRLAVRRRPG